MQRSGKGYAESGRGCRRNPNEIVIYIAGPYQDAYEPTTEIIRIDFGGGVSRGWSGGHGSSG